MVNYVTFQEMVNRLAKDGIWLLLDFNGELTTSAKIIGDTSAAEGYVMLSNNPWVKIRFDEIGDPVNHFEYGESLTIDQVDPKPVVMFCESTFLNDLIEEATGEIENVTGRIYGDLALTDSKDFDVADHQIEFWLGRDPIVSIDTVTYRDVVQSWVEKTDYWIYKDIGLFKVVLDKVASGNPQNLNIAFTYGELIPPGIRAIAKDMIINVYDDYQRQRNLGGGDSMGMADFNVKFTKRPMMDEFIEKRLQRYKALQLAGL